MLDLPIYFDNHATTRVDPRVVEVMLPYFSEVYGNADSATHSLGWAAREAVGAARAKIAAAIGATANEIVFTSGATESNNLAIRGVAERYAARGRHIVSVATEHHAVLDPLAKLAARGFEVTLVPVVPGGQPEAGLVRLDQLAEAIRPDREKLLAVAQAVFAMRVPDVSQAALPAAQAVRGVLARAKAEIDAIVARMTKDQQ